MTLIASSDALPSGASQQSSGITLTALCKDSNNNAFQGAAVTFSSSAGLLIVTQSTTDVSGTALATLTTGGDATNRTINVTATSTVQSNTLQIAEQGTAIQISGASVVGSGGKVTYTVSLSDSSNNGLANQPLTVTSALGNGISPSSTLTTDPNGHATFTYTGTKGGIDTLTVSSANLSATTTSTVTVSGTSLSFTLPSGTTQPIPFNTATQVQVQYINGGSPVAGQTINFSTSRGTLTVATPTLPCTTTSTSVSSLAATTDSTGKASVYLCTDGSQGAGGVIVTASVAGGGPSSSLPLQFNATSAAAITVEATPTTIAPSSSSTIKAVVYDASNNLVQGVGVTFSLTDPTGGGLSSSTGTTDATGSVSVTYNATKVSSAQGGVQITATVTGTSIVSPAPAKITVGGQALRISLGTGNTISALDATRYQMPYSVIVTDSAGNPVPNATFNLTIQSVAYQKGFEAWNAADTLWEQVEGSLVPSTDNNFNSAAIQKTSASNPLVRLPFGCITEDPTNAGIYSTALDYNQNGVLDPGAVASVPSTVALDSTGSAQFFITYPKDHANWVEVLLTGIATVSGTETTATAEFILPGLASDFDVKAQAPPGQISPYGDSANEPPTFVTVGGVLERVVTANNCQSPN